MRSAYRTILKPWHYSVNALHRIAIFCACLALTMGCEIVIFRFVPATPPPLPFSLVSPAPFVLAVRPVVPVVSYWNESSSENCLTLNYSRDAFIHLHVRTVYHRFIRVLDCEDKICEFNQEACRINSYNGKKSLIRSFPSTPVSFSHLVCFCS